MPDDRATQDIVHGVPPIAVSTGTTLANRTGSWKYIQPIYQDKIAPCNAACPVGIDIEGCMNLLGEGKVAEARDLLLRENPLPAVTGRVCEHACQTACHRGSFDEAVNIHAIERMLGDLDDAAPPAPAPRRSERVAVVGAGPAGLSCAYHLARLGYHVTVLEADPEPGGWLRYGVPEYRLPRAVLGREIDRIRAAGVEFACGVRVGGNRAWKDLEGYDAIFLAAGGRTRDPYEWERHDVPDVRPGIDFLRDVRAGKRGTIGRRVVIVGGSDIAVDCARTAARLGSEATLVFPGPRADMQADPETLAEAIEEGVRFEFMTKPVGLQAADHVEDEPAIDAIRTMFDAGEADQPRPRLVGVACVRMRTMDPAATGARWLMPAPASALVIPADTLLTALGAEPDIGFLPPDVHRRGFVVKADAFGRTSRANVFAGGDAAGEQRTVAHAIGSGKRGAIGIDRHLRTRAGEPVPDLDAKALRLGGAGNMSITRWRGDDPMFRTNELNEVVPFERINLAYFTHAPSRFDRHRDPSDGGGDFAETNLGLTRDQALAEAKRCFNCGVCNMCEQCMIFCPDLAIKRHASGHGFSLSYKYCKGCGLCVEECPRGAMTMTREGL